jgi:hypothetical protein
MYGAGDAGPQTFCERVASRRIFEREICFVYIEDGIRYAWYKIPTIPNLQHVVTAIMRALAAYDAAREFQECVG